jgi:hypothetical protein
MNEGGYHHSSLFVNLDRYVERADVGALRKALGIAATPVLATAQKAAAPSSAPSSSGIQPPSAAPAATEASPAR